MKIAILFKIFLIFYSLVSFLAARPVSYVGGWTLMSFNDHTRNSMLVHYTPSFKYSLGYNVEYWNDKEYWINNFNLNYLFKRVNTKKSQANFYLKSGLGLLYSDFDENNAEKEYVAFTNFSADWETRRQFFSYETEYIRSESIADTFIQKGRIGFAPYLAGYGKLHTWLMYELNHMPENDDTLTSSAVLRFFKSTHLLEVGVDEKRNISMNYIKRF